MKLDSFCEPCNDVNDRENKNSNDSDGMARQTIPSKAGMVKKE
jgi:hypothetical protein